MNAKDEFLKAIIANLELYNWDEFMNLCYNMLIAYPQDAIDHTGDTNAKTQYQLFFVAKSKENK